MKPISPAWRAVSARLEGDRKLSMVRLQREADDQQHDHRDRGLGPALGQDLAEEMIGPVAISQASQSVAHQRPV